MAYSVPDYSFIVALIIIELLEIKSLNILKYLIALAPMVEYLILIISRASLTPIPAEKPLILGEYKLITTIGAWNFTDKLVLYLLKVIKHLLGVHWRIRVSDAHDRLAARARFVRQRGKHVTNV